MKLFSLRNQTSIASKEIESSVQSLLFVMTMRKISGADFFSNATMASALAALEFVTAEISLQLQNPSSSTTLIQSVPLKTLAKLNSAIGGMVTLDTVMIPAPPSSTTGYPISAYRLQFKLDLAIDAAIRFDDNTKLVLTLEKGNSGDDENVFETQVFALDHPNTSNTVVSVEAKSISDGITKEFVVDSSFALGFILPEVNTLELLYTNGKTIKMDRQELASLSSTDSVLVAQTKDTLGYTYMHDGFKGEFTTLNIEDVVSFKINSQGNNNIYLLKNILL